jgi:hypothetical protein
VTGLASVREIVSVIELASPRVLVSVIEKNMRGDQ